MRGVHDAPSSVVSKIPKPWTIAQARGLVGVRKDRGKPRWPGGWFVGMFHSSRPAARERGLERPGRAAVAALEHARRLGACRRRPCAAVSPETFDA